MSLMVWLLGSGPKSSKRTALHFYDDESFELIKRHIKDTFFILKEGEKVVEAWCHFFKTQFQFDGYKGISGDQVTITFDRDVCYDPYDILTETEKPVKTGALQGALKQPYISRIANSKVHEAQKQKKGGTIMDKITWGLLAIIGVECLILLLGRVSCGGGG